MTGVLQPGTDVAGFVVQSVIAHGGMGVVYLAKQERPNREVALKLISPERASDPAYRERFLRESELLAGLEHPNIVPIHAAGEWEGQLYLAMRYIRGETLADRVIRRPSLTPSEALRILTPIADALTAAHEEGVVHRDIKPANILLSARGHVYLTDFGLTKRTGSDPSLTRPGTAIGTEGYMAPEQFTGKVDPAFATRIDIYALGCVLHACLTGVEPYPRDSYEASLWAHVFSPPPSLADRVPALAYLDPILARAMAKDPADRYAAANTMIAELGAAIDAAPLMPEPVEQAPPPTAAAATSLVPAPPIPDAPARRPVADATTLGQPSGSASVGEATVLARPSETPTRMEAPAPVALPVVGSAVGQPPPPASPGSPAGGRTLPNDPRTRRRLALAAVAGCAGVIALALWMSGVGRGDGGGVADASATPRPSVTVRPATPSPTATPVDAVAALTARVPPAAQGCAEARPRSDAADVAIQCTAWFPTRIVYVQYAQFADPTTLQTAWSDYIATLPYGPGAGDCPATEGEQPWSVAVDGESIEKGRVLCYTSTATEAVIEWTNLEQSVWASAWQPNIDLAALDAIVSSGDLNISGAAGG